VLKAATVLLRRDLRLAARQGVDSVMALAFFVIAVVLFPFGVGPEPAVLSRIAAGVIWVAALLASMLSLERLFQADADDGTLTLLALTATPLEIVAAAKVAAHWLTTGLPLIVVSPLLGVLLHLESHVYLSLLAALALGTPTISLVGGVGAALILGARRGSVLLSLLVLPMVVPVLIFGVAAVDAAQGGYPVFPALSALLGFLLAALVLTPWAAAAALRQFLGE